MAEHNQQVMTQNEQLEIAHEAYFRDLRVREYPSLDSLGQIYLDFTGGNLYSLSQISRHHKLLESNIFGNPHSISPASSLSSKLIEETRSKIIDFFNAHEYYCIFTQNATGALKIVGECYPFGPHSHLLLFSDNHNSVNGIREYCKSSGGTFSYVPIQYEDLRIDAKSLQTSLNDFRDCDRKLLAFPAQSNVSGVKHSLSWISIAQQKGWDVLLDAAAYVPTSSLNLEKHRADYVSISFYKIFGYPTGLGCLLVRKSKFNHLIKHWFAGGTVKLAGVMSPHHYLADNHERFENGTLNYLDIPALKIGLDYIEHIGMDRISERVTSLMRFLSDQLLRLRHNAGVHQVKIFGPKNRKDTGATMIMSFFNPDGQPIPFEIIESRASAQGISIRSGCFCNPGLDEIQNCLTTDELSGYFSSRDKGDYRDMILYLQKLRGATRVSVGIATVKQDLVAFIQFVKNLANQTL